MSLTSSLFRGSRGRKMLEIVAHNEKVNNMTDENSKNTGIHTHIEDEYIDEYNITRELPTQENITNMNLNNNQENIVNHNNSFGNYSVHETFDIINLDVELVGEDIPSISGILSDSYQPNVNKNDNIVLAAFSPLNNTDNKAISLVDYSNSSESDIDDVYNVIAINCENDGSSNVVNLEQCVGLLDQQAHNKKFPEVRETMSGSSSLLEKISCSPPLYHSPDDTDYCTDTENVSSSESSDEAENFRGKRPRKKASFRDLNKRRKMMGKSYLTYKGTEVAEKKVLPNPCAGKRCVNNCNSFSEDEREILLKSFWSLENNVERHAFINGCVNIVPVKRRRTTADVSRRGLTQQYFFMTKKGQQRVCLQFFLKTLNISQKIIRHSVEGKTRANDDRRGRHSPKHIVSAERKSEFEAFIQRLPAVPSHYCRSSTQKLYLPADIRNYANLYRLYRKAMEEDNKKPISETCFRSLLKKTYNIGIHVPKKDKCVKCEKFKNIPESSKTDKDTVDFIAHEKERNDAKIVFLEDQSKSGKDHYLVATFDLQKVLTTPHGRSMMFGFSRKYAVYNFTVYESKTQNGYCYLWGEKDGKRGVVEICSNLFRYLTHLDNNESCHRLSLYCDNCPGQNKNKYILSMLGYFLHNSKNINEIKLTYLVAGHTYMPVDSMHAVIEKYSRNVTVQAPSEWPTIIRNARRRPKPYEVITCNRLDFKDWKAVTFSSKKLATKSGDALKFSEIKVIKLSKECLPVIQVSTKSYDLTEDIQEIEISFKTLNEVPLSYKNDIPISKPKLRDLLNLCNQQIIKTEYHGEYFSLRSSSSVPDELAETDIEDDCQ